MSEVRVRSSASRIIGHQVHHLHRFVPAEVNKHPLPGSEKVPLDDQYWVQPAAPGAGGPSLANGPSCLSYIW
jgi:hypothetical protein